MNKSQTVIMTTLVVIAFLILIIRLMGNDTETVELNGQAQAVEDGKV